MHMKLHISFNTSGIVKDLKEINFLGNCNSLSVGRRETFFESIPLQWQSCGTKGRPRAPEHRISPPCKRRNRQCRTRHREPSVQASSEDTSHKIPF